MSSHPWTAVDHYENFPVGSWLVPARARPGFVALYRFAREADDIADEGEHAPRERLRRLARLAQAITEPQAGPDPDPECVVRLWPFIERHGLQTEELLKLLSAFCQDVNVNRYPNRAELLRYCERSANPVGRLVLKLFAIDDDGSIALSDHICTALQLINFLQDVGIDWGKGRVYVPQETLNACGSTDRDIGLATASGTPSEELRRALAVEADFAAHLLLAGRPLLKRVPWRLALELRAVLAGAARVLERIRNQNFNVFSARPTLGWKDAPALIRLSLSVSR
jgi:squalene synthase HpnC